MIQTSATGTKNNYNSIVNSINIYRRHSRDYLEKKKKEEEQASEVSKSIVEEVKAEVAKVFYNTKITQKIVDVFWNL